MARFALFLLVVMGIWSCSGIKKADSAQTSRVEIEQDSASYELVVMDPGFSTYMATLPYSKTFYSNAYYQQWNIRYCTEWNIRYANPLRYGDFYQVNIPYDSSLDYGLDFNFELYHYFLFIEKQYGIVLISRRGKPVSY